MRNVLADPRLGDAMVDELLYFKSADIKALEHALRNDAGRTLLARLLWGSTRLEVRPGRLDHAWTGKVLPKHSELVERLNWLDELVSRLSGQLGDRTIGHPWQRLGQKTDLQFSEGASGTGMLLSGSYRGHRVRVDLVESRSSLATRIEIQLNQAMPAGLRALPVVDDLVSGVDLRSPILDGRIAAFGRPPEQVRSLLNQDQVIPALMSLLQKHSAAGIQDQSIKIELPRTLDDVEFMAKLLDDMLDLAVALDEAVGAQK